MLQEELKCSKDEITALRAELNVMKSSDGGSQSEAAWRSKLRQAHSAVRAAVMLRDEMQRAMDQERTELYDRLEAAKLLTSQAEKRLQDELALKAAADPLQPTRPVESFPPLRLPTASPIYPVNSIYPASTASQSTLFARLL